MSWTSAIENQRLAGEVIRLRAELERACRRIQQLEGKAAESDPEFHEKESHDSTSPYWMTHLNISQ